MLMIICILMLILASASVDMSGTVPVYNVYTVYYYVSSIYVQKGVSYFLKIQILILAYEIKLY